MIRSIAMVLLGFGGIVLLIWLLLAFVVVISILRYKTLENGDICLLTDCPCIHQDDGVECAQCHLCGESPSKDCFMVCDDEADDRK